LIDALTMQKMIAGDVSLAEELARFVELQEIRAGETIIHQGDADNTIFFILPGSFHIVVNGTVLAKRGPNDHVGEMAAIEPSQARTATVIAAEDSLICKLTEPQLTEIGQRHGAIWRSLARELVRRLAQRNLFVPPPRQHIRLFILSSSEALPIAHEVQNSFAHDNFSVVICLMAASRHQPTPLKAWSRRSMPPTLLSPLPNRMISPPAGDTRPPSLATMSFLHWVSSLDDLGASARSSSNLVGIT
jgi:CRP-like cAMP-binding protein